MFIEFFYLLRSFGLKVSLDEWLTLCDALDRGLHGSGLTGFYYLARAVLIKTEADFDKFDGAFLAYFKGVERMEKLPPELEEWLSRPIEQRPYDKDDVDSRFGGKDFEEILRQFEERLKTQDSAHHGGSHWIGTGGTSMFGHSGYNPNGVRVGGESKNRSAVQIAGSRVYRDYREDSVLGLRQFQVAFRRLRQFSTLSEGPKDVLELDETIRKTGDNAGNLELVFTRPRRNMVKVLLLFDSGGSMSEFASLCATLFQAANKSNQFKDLKVWYFHNCIYDDLYTTPACYRRDSIPTDWVLKNLSSEYRVIVVGDAYMSPYELLRPNGCIDYGIHNKEPGIDWICKFTSRYERMIWLNPMPERYWGPFGYSSTIQLIRDKVPMFPLSVEGLERGLRQLMSVRA